MAILTIIYTLQIYKIFLKKKKKKGNRIMSIVFKLTVYIAHQHIVEDP